ncbi:MAG: CPBP family intramembrane metalloprotease [Bacteroidia bacterium]
MKKGFEIALIFLTAILKWILVDAYGLRGYFIPTAFLIWLAFIVYNVRVEENFFINAGFNKRNLKPTSLISLILIIGFSGIMIGYGKLNHFDINTRNFTIAVCTYPIWGLLQQFIVMRFVASNLQSLNLNKAKVITITTFAFGVVHIPIWPLFAATCLIGFAFTALYIRYKNLWPLGIAHGILGAFFYFYVLNEDPIAQLLLTF